MSHLRSFNRKIFYVFSKISPHIVTTFGCLMHSAENCEEANHGPMRVSNKRGAET